MNGVGIIAEFNPIHSGHIRLIEEAKKYGTVVCVMSGNFVQRGDLAIAEKRVRAKAALLCGVDLVLELPVPWAMSTAQNFAFGGVSQLANIGCDTIIFGSECGNMTDILKACDILCSDEYSKRLIDILKTGVTFAFARDAAASEFGVEKNFLTGANNNLAVEYVMASRILKKQFDFKTIKREGANHDSDITHENYVSASLLRNKLKCGDYDFCSKYIPDKALKLFSGDNIADIKNIDTAVIAALRAKKLEELKGLPDLSEGIENKLFSSIRLATGLEELYNTVKVKRYTHARIRRLALSAFLNIDNSFFLRQPPYIRVLGFNEKGECYLRAQAKSCKVPVVTKSKEIEALSSYSQKVFDCECLAADMFSLSMAKPLPCGAEYLSKIIKTECC